MCLWGQETDPFHMEIPLSVHAFFMDVVAEVRRYCSMGKTHCCSAPFNHTQKIYGKKHAEKLLQTAFLSLYMMNGNTSGENNWSQATLQHKLTLHMYQVEEYAWRLTVFPLFRGSRNTLSCFPATSLLESVTFTSA